MKNKVALSTIIILALLTVAISTPTISQPPSQQTSYRIDQTWYLGTLNFTVVSLFVYNVNFTDGDIEFTVDNIPKNVSVAVEIPAEITCNPKFTSPLSIPVYVSWRLEGGGATGGGFMFCLPNGEILHSFKSNIGAFLPKDMDDSVFSLDGYVSVSLLHRVSIPTTHLHYTLHLKRAI